MKIREELDDPEIQLLLIGQAGENLVRFASVISPLGRAAGRTGMGAVMGSKKLKAIAVRGTKDINVARPEEFFSVCQDSTIAGRSDPKYKRLRSGGSAYWMDALAPIGAAGVGNYRKTLFPNWTALSGERMQPGGEFSVRQRGCLACPVMCGGFFNVRSGEFAQTFDRNPEFGMTFIGLSCEIDNLPAILAMETLFDKYGMDCVSGGQLISWAMDCYDRGILTHEDCDGISLEWGNYAAVTEIIHKIANRDGIGDLLAEGEKRASQKLGRGSEKFMYHIKGMAPVIEDPRTNKLFGFAYYTASRGADHLNANVSWIPHLVKGTDIEKELISKHEKWGTIMSVAHDKSTAVMGETVKVCEDISAIINSSSTCMRAAGAFKSMARALSTATGIDFNLEKLYQIGERIYNMQKAFNSREGLTRKDDNFPFPEKFTVEPVAEGHYQGDVLFELDRMLDDYYRARGWDPETGLQTRAKLEELGLNQVRQELEKVNAVK